MDKYELEDDVDVTADSILNSFVLTFKLVAVSFLSIMSLTCLYKHARRACATHSTPSGYVLTVPHLVGQAGKQGARHLQCKNPKGDHEVTACSRLASLLSRLLATLPSACACASGPRVRLMRLHTRRAAASTSRAARRASHFAAQRRVHLVDAGIPMTASGWLRVGGVGAAQWLRGGAVVRQRCAQLAGAASARAARICTRK